MRSICTAVNSTLTQIRCNYLFIKDWTSSNVLWKHYSVQITILYIFINDLFIFLLMVGFMFMVFNTTFNNISAISWQSVLLLKETGVPGENYGPVASY